MNKFKIVIGISLIFFAGTLAGSLVTGKMFQKKVEKHWKSGRLFPLHLVMGRLSDDLRLSDVQRREIERVLQDAQERLQELRNRNQPEFQKVIDDAFDRIRKHLDADQQKRLEQMHRSFRNRHRKKEKHHCRSPGHMRMNIGKIADQLNLPPEKAEQIRPILEKAQARIREIEDADERRREEHRRTRRRVMRDLERELSSVLSSEEMRGFKMICEKNAENPSERSF